jgi:hypothetical protein
MGFSINQSVKTILRKHICVLDGFSISESYEKNRDIWVFLGLIRNTQQKVWFKTQKNIRELHQPMVG